MLIEGHSHPTSIFVFHLALIVSDLQELANGTYEVFILSASGSTDLLFSQNQKYLGLLLHFAIDTV